MAAALAIGAAASGGCAPKGHLYDDCPDGGVACSPPSSDAGTIDTSGFISPPVTIFHDGNHNSDGDVVLFQGAAWAVFRNAKTWSADGTAKLVVSRSGDKGQTWTSSAELAIKDTDLREPKLAVFQNKLLVTATSWDPTTPTQHHTRVVGSSSDDGTTFTDLASLGLPDGAAAWRPRLLVDRLWMTSWKADELFPASAGGPLTLWSSDGKAWSSSTTLPVGAGGRQGELLLRASKDLWAAVPERAVPGDAAKLTFCSAALGPTLSWSCWSVANQVVESPVLFEYSGLLFVAAKHDLGDGRRRTALWQVMDLDRDVSLIADLPTSMGDTGAPGILPLDASHALLTFHGTSPLDPKVAALGHEPTEVEAQSLGLAADVFVVTLDLSKAVAGR